MTESINYCLTDIFGSEFELKQVENLESYKLMMKRPARVIIPNVEGYEDQIKVHVEKLRVDGCDVDLLCGDTIDIRNDGDLLPTSNDPVNTGINVVKMAMSKACHSLHRGNVYRKAPGGRFTQYMSDLCFHM